MKKKRFKLKQRKLVTALATIAVLVFGYFFSTNSTDVKAFTHGPRQVTTMRRHYRHWTKQAENWFSSSSNSGSTQTTPTTADVPRDATDSQLLALQFDANKYPENYVSLGKSTLTSLQIHDALEHNHEQAWYTIDSPDTLGRSQAGQALVTYNSVSATAAMKRPSFAESADPIGYEGNNRIAQLSGYRGYFYNRSHTLAWSLVGNLGGPDTSSNAIMQRNNLTTGTRAQNVGTNGRSQSTAGGMAYAETAIREFVRERPNIPVYYVVTPLYQGNELVPRGTHVQAVSTTDDGQALNINVYVFNAQSGATINYSDGSWTQN
ncbi:MAG: endonuclease [Furfurilactobacillus sp.]|uniref:endonuclease n=1 Tax=Furfurilactobacillus sp. TaxID=2767911 RepID=UPI00258DA7D6|nr:endonuclease [Furfurilactobacillus sp.]MCH4012052.1 endonuclease [Furfurilactobacillus sp.]MCH4037944.1 endonuclease [Furfurilactobacillus sp.]MCH4115419.1 endonuclease [Furfurilactobacillus sp.]MCI1341036.1 endonuclease [Furfurilactobacillus sp.]MCI1387886.1 endonuclease [Furfurilactobacillus sp.]